MNDEFDDILRARLQQSEPTPSAGARGVFGQLEPAMRRARIRRGVAIGAATLSLLGVSGIGLAAVVSTVRSQPSDIDILVDVDPLPAPNPITSSDDEDETDRELAGDELDGVTSSTSSLPRPTSTTVEADDPAANDAVKSTTPAATTQPPASVAPTPLPATPGVPAPTNTAPTPPPPSTVEPSNPPSTSSTTTTSTSTTSTTTTVPISIGQRTVESNCGSIIVSNNGNSISLDSTHPAAGFSVDVKNSGPEQVEVGLADGNAECEIKAWMESGVLTTFVDNHEEG